MAETPLSSEIETNAEGPQEAQADGVRVRQHSLRDQIAADKYLAAKNQATRSALPIRVGSFKPGPPGGS